MVTISCLLIGSFLILQTHGTSVRPRVGCNGDPNAETGCDTCGTNCNNYDLEPRACSDRTCLKDECKCRDGFVRNSERLCIPYAECPKMRCGINEVHTECLPACGQDTCERAGKKRSVCPVPCKSRGCVCRKNFFRNADDVCTSVANCMKCQKPNEVFGCRRTCDDKTCASLTKPCNITNIRCTEKCYCRKGYARDRGGQCIPIDQCPRKCPINEEHNCVKPCPPRTCLARRAKYMCAPNQKCINKCDCKSGFLRNTKGICVAVDDCDKESSQPKCPINQVYKCVPPCPVKRCPSKWHMLYRCLPNQKCTNKCDCKDGFLKNGQGTCIPSDQCDKDTKPVRCAANEEYKCVQTCPPKTCQARFAKFRCVANQKCVNKCECKDNYLRNKEGGCVLASQCDGIGQPTCPINQEYKCVKPCPPQICLPRFGVIRYSCRPNQKCTNKCDCIEGFLKNGQGTCVPKNQCHKQTSQPKCPINQEYKCVLPCPQKICPSKLFRRYSCLPNQKCTYKCDCIDGFLKNGQGTCVPSNQCNKKSPINPDSADSDPANPGTVDRDLSDPDPADSNSVNSDPANPDPADRDSSDPEPADPDSVNSDPENPDPADRESSDPDPADPDSVNSDPENPNPADRDLPDSDPGNPDQVDPNPAEPDTGAPKLGGPDPIPNEPGPDDDSDDCDDEN